MEGRLDGDVPRQTKLSLTLPVPLSAPGAQPPIKPVTPAVSTSLFDPEDVIFTSTGYRSLESLPADSENQFLCHDLCFHFNFNPLPCVGE